MTSDNDRERQPEFGIIIHIGGNCWGPEVGLIVVVYNDMRKASVKECGMK
jgi:hypothetical protein